MGEGKGEHEMKDCTCRESCSAPLCPLDQESLENGIWYPGEDICTKRGVEFTARQRRIARTAAGSFLQTCFTASMLKHKFAISKGLRGLNPETRSPETEKKWFEKHKGRAPLSDEKKAQMSERIKNLRNQGFKGIQTR